MDGTTMTWTKEHLLEAIGLVVTLLTYFGIQPSDVAANISILTPALYVVAGGLMGWGLCRASHGLRFRLFGTRHSDEQSIDDFAEVFASAPYEIKAFLKTVLEKGAAYRKTDDFFPWESHLEYLSIFVIGQTIRNNITKFTMRDDMREFFDERPDLLESVSDEDVESHALNGNEGDSPTFMSRHFFWWYYTDDPNVPKAFNMSNSIFGMGM